MAYDNFTDELKAQLNIVDIIGREVTLKKSGSNRSEEHTSELQSPQ